MDDLIRRSSALKVLDNEACWWAHEAMNRLPAVDAVEVVRCKDCKHRFNRPICAYKGDDWFCGYGERREENDNDA